MLYNESRYVNRGKLKTRDESSWLNASDNKYDKVQYAAQYNKTVHKNQSHALVTSGLRLATNLPDAIVFPPALSEATQ